MPAPMLQSAHTASTTSGMAKLTWRFRPPPPLRRQKLEQEEVRVQKTTFIHILFLLMLLKTQPTVSSRASLEDKQQMTPLNLILPKMVLSGQFYYILKYATPSLLQQRCRFKHNSAQLDETVNRCSSISSPQVMGVVLMHDLSCVLLI